MTALDLLAALDRAGVVLGVNEDRLAYDAPKGAVTPDLLAEMKTHKVELIGELRRRDHAIAQRIRDHVARLVPYRTPDGRQGWVHPRYREELERLGL